MYSSLEQHAPHVAQICLRRPKGLLSSLTKSRAGQLGLWGNWGWAGYPKLRELFLKVELLVAIQYNTLVHFGTESL